MIVKGSATRKFRFLDFPMIFIPAVLIIGLVLLASRNSSAEDNYLQESELVRSLDMELVSGSKFTSGDDRYDGGVMQTDTFARSGDFSVEANADQIYVLEHWYPVEQSGRMQASIWRYSPTGKPGWLVVTTHNTDDFYQVTQTPVERKGKWEKLVLDLNVPERITDLKIYCYTDQDAEGSVYFDDYTLHREPPVKDYGTVQVPEVALEVSGSGMLKLQTKRDEAWQKGILESATDDWTDARITYDGQTFLGKLRLKGDWLDHLEGNKWSFRIKLKDGAIDGKQVFSLQSPHTRSFLSEWIFHKMLDQEDILSPSYQFVKLKLNNQVLGIYAMEEHFVKGLVEHRARREGPIVKLTEDDFWDSIKRQFELKGKDQFFDASIGERAFWSSQPQSFEEENGLANPRLGKQTERAYALMAAYKYNAVPLHEVVDAERVGKYLAIVDLTQAYHGLSWHNQRWYYNPLSDRLEPIGFDGYTEDVQRLLDKKILTRQAYQENNSSHEPYRHFFYDPQIMQHYQAFLHTLSHTDYVGEFIRKNQGETDHLLDVIQSEYSAYRYDLDELQERADLIRISFAPGANSLKLYQAGDQQFLATNSHSLPLFINSFRGSGNIIQPVDPAIFIPPTSFTNRSIEVALPSDTKEVWYGQFGIERSYRSEVSPWQLTRAQTIRPDLALVEQAGFHIIDQEVHANQITLTRPLIIPSGYQLVLDPGDQIDLVEGAYLMCQDAVQINGSIEAPVTILSSDQTGAFAVMQAKTRSQVRHCQFAQLATIDRDGYVLTGGTTFYQADVDLSHVVFRDNVEEDALNLVNCDYTMQHCHFANTAFDAFDSDFCTGQINNCYFDATGNDALDFSGSTATISNVEMFHIGDKGISAGEHSHILVKSMAITDSKIGAVAKDLSELTIEDISLVRVREGFAAYRKKIDFGPATLIVHQYQAEDVRHLQLKEDGSEIRFLNPG